jgi:predicted CoA-substrate-specific enzyme activase
MIVVGVDAGSRAIKAVLWDAECGGAAASGVVDQGVEQDALALRLLARLLADAGRTRAEVARIVATGCGRHILRFADAAMTEITCHAVGVRHVAPDANTIVEVGGQDSKLIRLDRNGVVRDFVMNDRCAAGTGRFLEMAATRLGVSLGSFGALAERCRKPAVISSMCVVFAETEIIGLLASGVAPEDIAAGIQASIAARVAGMSGRRIETPIVFTGGVALVPGMAAALEAAFRQPVSTAPEPLMTGALGAALLAARDLPDGAFRGRSSQ